MTVLELSEEQQDEIAQFAAEESARLAKSGALNPTKEKDRSVWVVQDTVRKHEWPKSTVAKDWLANADVNAAGKLRLAARASALGIPALRLSMYRHEALVQLFAAFKANDISDVIKQVRTCGYQLSGDGVHVMRYNVLVLSYLVGMYWSCAVASPAAQIGFWVRQWWKGVPAWRESGPPIRQTAPEEQN